MRARYALGTLAVVALFASSAYAADAPKAVEPVRTDVAVVDQVTPADPVGAVEPAASVDTDDAMDACELNYTPADPEESLDPVSALGGCKPCKDRPQCKCTYNGLPRVSCNPCCWGNLGIPQICAD